MFFLLKDGPPWTFILWMKKIKFFLTLWCLEQKREAPKASDAFGAPFKDTFPLFTKREQFFFKTFFYKSFPFYK